MSRNVLLVGLLTILLSSNAFSQESETPLLDQIFSCEECWLSSDEKLLKPLQNQTLYKDWTYSVGGALRYRYIDEQNRLRPPVTAGRSTYDQVRFTPFLELQYDQFATFYVQAIDSSTFGNELPQTPIDENRSDLLQYYVDLKLIEFDNDGELHFKFGRQFLQYGSQHLISPLAWSNTFRNFEGFKLYYTDASWNIDAFAVQPVDGASGNIFRPRSSDSPDQSRWFSGVYTTYKKAPHGVIDLYWLWLNETEDKPNLIDGNRHTLGTRYAGTIPIKDAAKTIYSWNWDLEGAWQLGREDFLTGANQDIQAGFVSTNGGLTLDSVPWSPALNAIFFWGSGDQDPNDGTSNTVNTLFPLGHAYWGQIDNFNGQNLLDYGLHFTVKPTSKLSFLTGWHWFDKASKSDAIYNVGGVPFGGATPTSSRHLGNELDLIATYQINKNLQLQAGYFWFWYGDAVTQNPNPQVANRDDAEQFYMFVDWAF